MSDGVPDPLPEGGLAPLRLAVLVRGSLIPAWQAVMLERIHAEGAARIVLVESGDDVAAPSPELDARCLRESPLGQLQTRLSGVAGIADPFLAVSMPEACMAAAVPQDTAGTSPDRRARLKAARPDLILWLGGSAPDQSCAQVPRYGVWTLWLTGEHPDCDSLPGERELLAGVDTVSAQLVRNPGLTDQSVVNITHSAVYRDSALRTAMRHAWKAMPLVPRELQRLQRMGVQVWSTRTASPPVPDCRPAPLTPGWLPKLRLRARTSATALAQRVTARLAPDQWRILLADDPASAAALRKHRVLQPPRGRHWADPFVWSRSGRNCLFVEEQIGDLGKGFISVIDLDQPGTPVAEPVLSHDWHLSFPFLLEHDGDLYMIPECREAGCIALYRCREFPLRWERMPNLMNDVGAADTVVFHRDGLWWLFATIVEHAAIPSTDELSIFHARHFPTANWTPHPCNPVVSDVRRGRSAGAPYLGEDGYWYRPSQDCSRRYGWAVNLNRIDRLTVDAYAESLAHRITPDWSDQVSAVHTFNRHGRYSVLDAQFRGALRR